MDVPKGLSSPAYPSPVYTGLGERPQVFLGKGNAVRGTPVTRGIVSLATWNVRLGGVSAIEASIESAPLGHRPLHGFRAARLAFATLWRAGTRFVSPRFIVATIKPSDPNRAEADGNVGFTPSGSFDAKSQSLKEIIEFVQDLGYYNVDQRIVGGPKWLGSSKFDIAAKCDEETARAFGKMTPKQQIRTEQNMVQALLVDRFKLRTHHELWQFPVYALVQTKSGSKVKLSGKTREDELSDAHGAPGNWKASGVTMKVLANELSSLPEIGGKIVVDRTGLKGSFDFVIRWTPDPTMGATRPSADDGLNSDSSAPSLLTALQEQLGLKLESTKEPVDVIVIDSAELPTPN